MRKFKYKNEDVLYSRTISVLKVYNHKEALHEIIEERTSKNELVPFKGKSDEQILDFSVNLSIFEDQLLDGVRIEGSKVFIKCNDRYISIGDIANVYVSELYDYCHSDSVINKSMFEILGGRTKIISYNSYLDQTELSEEEYDYSVNLHLKYIKK